MISALFVGEVVAVLRVATWSTASAGCPLAILVIFAAAFEGALVVGIPADFASGFCADALAVVLIASGASGG